MKYPAAPLIPMLLPFGLAVYVLDRYLAPMSGMMVAQGLSAVLLLGMLAVYLLLSSRESDEREQLLRLQSDSAALYVVIAGLLAVAIFYPGSGSGRIFWIAIGLAALGRIVAFFYHRNK